MPCEIFTDNIDCNCPDLEDLDGSIEQQNLLAPENETNTTLEAENESTLDERNLNIEPVQELHETEPENVPNIFRYWISNMFNRIHMGKPLNIMTSSPLAVTASVNKSPCKCHSCPKTREGPVTPLQLPLSDEDREVEELDREVEELLRREIILSSDESEARPRSPHRQNSSTRHQQRRRRRRQRFTMPNSPPSDHSESFFR